MIGLAAMRVQTELEEARKCSPRVVGSQSFEGGRHYDQTHHIYPRIAPPPPKIDLKISKSGHEMLKIRPETYKMSQVIP